MAVIIHFFRLRTKPRIDYEKLIYFFDGLDYCTINTNDDNVEMVCTDPIFDFPYRFLITKRSRVNSIYNLNSEYYNINLLVEIPSVLPEFVSRGILKFISELCHLFELDIYYNGVKDIEPFDMTKMIAYLAHERSAYLEEHKELEPHYVKRDKLNQICNFQQMLPYLPEKFKGEAIANPYLVFVDNRNQEVVFSVVWKLGTAMFFPPHLDYIHIEDENQFTTIVPAQVFFKYAEKHMFEIKDLLPNMRLLLLQGRNVNRVKKLMRKFRKVQESATNFTEIRIIDLIES
ncbi:MAG TPA: hypothetical protein PK840_03630 [Bacilli bacterium]|nr:hypothetical protein [Bacilli bacterium]HPD12699.1 hypothetical protein [Bacilli bacterium]